LVTAAGTAKDLAPGDPHVSICWDDQNLTILPKYWNLGASGLGVTHQAKTYAPFAPPNGLVVRNNGTVREKFTVSCSGASQNGQIPYAWALASNADQDEFEMKVDNATPLSGNYALDLATGPKDIVNQIYSGYSKGFDLLFKTPLSITTGAGATQTITVTISATQD
jgi:hypothetical protein